MQSNFEEEWATIAKRCAHARRKKNRLASFLYGTAVIASVHLLLLARAEAQSSASKCQHSLEAMISRVDLEIIRFPNGPIGELRRYLDSQVPIEGCEFREFESAVKKSAFLQQIGKMVNYDIAVITNNGVEVGISYYRQDKVVKEAYVLIRK